MAKKTIALTFIATQIVSCCCLAQIKPKDKLPQQPTLRIERHYEDLTPCDSLVLGLGRSERSPGMYCYSAYPSVYSGDGLLTSQYSFNEKNVQVAVLTPVRDVIPFDNTHVRAITKGERLGISFMLFARDSLTLVEVLENMAVQALKNGQWITKSTLNASDYSISNKRSYSYSCPPTGYDKNIRFFERVEAISQITLSSSRIRGGNIRPSMVLSENVMLPGEGFESRPGVDRPFDPSMPEGINRIDKNDERVLKDLSDHAFNKAQGAFDAWMDKKSSCRKKQLTYYWTDIYYEYTPDLNETQVRFNVNSNLVGPDNIVLKNKFNVYLAVAYHHNMPARDGSRKFDFYMKSSGNLTLDNLKASVVYNEGIISNATDEHRTFASFGTPTFYADYNLSVNNAKGIFPFTKKFYDDESQTDINRLSSNDDDINPVEIPGNKIMAYYIQVGSISNAPTNGLPFKSEINEFKMPPPLTFALMGDSYSSGQGAPMESGKPWMDDACHRSKNSGQYRAMNRFVKNSDKACDYFFIACEGAVIQDMTVQAQRTEHKPDGTTHGQKKQEKSQINLVQGWLNEMKYTHLNCALFSIGGNNIGFAPIIMEVLLSPNIHFDFFGTPVTFDTDGSLSQAMTSQMEDGFELHDGPNGYSNIDKLLKDKLKVNNVILFGYPDFTHDIKGQVCSSNCPDPGGLLNTIAPSEMATGSNILTRLNASLSTAASRHPNWHYVDIFDATKNHGICVCENSYYTSWDEATNRLNTPCSLGTGALPFGKSCSFHPNILGYEHYIAPILSKLNELYAN